MKKLLHIVSITVSIAVFLSGCAGYDRVLLATKTNVGLDVDSTPPTAEVTISRQEAGIQPTLPDSDGKDVKTNENQVFSNAERQENSNHPPEQTALPLLASFGLEAKTFFSPRITGYFAGGDAAVHLAGGTFNENTDSSICLKNEPGDMRSPIRWFYDNIIRFWTKDVDDLKEYRERPRPFIFATNTIFGLKASWSSLAGPVPDSLKIGYNRKEYASAPIFVYNGCDNGNTHNYNVKLPSFLATIDNASNLETFSDSGIKHVQFFATGLAAKNFAEKYSVRQAAFKNMAPDAAAIESTGVNDFLLSSIEEAFNKADISKQAETVKFAIENKFVPDKTTPTEFLDKLRKNNNSDYSLVTLRKYLI